MTNDNFTLGSPGFEPGGIKQEEAVPEEDALLEEEFAAEEPELEKQVLEAIEGEEQEVGVDSVRLYLNEIGRVPLLTAADEKTIARRIVIGKRISEVKSELGKQGKCGSGAEIYLEIIWELGLSRKIIHKLQDYLGLPASAKFCQIITDEKFRGAIDNVIDQVMVQFITDKLSPPSTQTAEQSLIELSVNSALLPGKILTAIGSEASLESIPNLVNNAEFIHKLEACQADLREYLERIEREAKNAKDQLIEANMRLVVSIAKKYIGHGLPMMVLIQEGNNGLMHAVEKFNPHKGFRFSTHAIWWIRQAITLAVANKARTIRLPEETIKTINKFNKAIGELMQELGRYPTNKEISEKMGISTKTVRQIKKDAEPLISVEQPMGEEEDDGELGDFIEGTDALPPMDASFKQLLMEQVEEVLPSLTDREQKVLRLRFGLRDGRSRTLQEVGQELNVSHDIIQLMEAKASRKLRDPSLMRKLKEYHVQHRSASSRCKKYQLKAVKISLASPEQIRRLSYGEVTKAETVNFRTLEPERDGLFCERIFGPTEDFSCLCGKYKNVRTAGVICDKCGVELTQAKVRRERMGHIDLVSPVSHIWFANGNSHRPSTLALLLDIPPQSLEQVLYFSHCIITSVDEDARQKLIAQLEKSPTHEVAGSTSGEVTKIKNVRIRKLLTDSEYHDLRQKYGRIFEAGMGAEAILKIVKLIDLDKLRIELIQEIRSSSVEKREKASKRLRVVEAFSRSGNKPEWMFITILPVLPPGLRPSVKLKNGSIAICDINYLYLGVINCNNRLRQFMKISAPEIIIRNEKRLLQESVDSLMDNGRRDKPVSVSGKLRLKSLSDGLRGKQGHFRRKMLGKYVDYSGRSVIISGPDLKLSQCGLPRFMALELFKPFIIQKLLAQGLANDKFSACAQIKKTTPEVHSILEEVVRQRPVLLNRAPTLHRLGVQVFEPVLIDGDAIQLHPLVCSAFNADFDGDTMAVHVPLSKAAVKEAREQMLSIHNMRLPSSGDLAVTPTLDIVLGCYYLTTIRSNAPGTGKRFGSFEEAKLAYDLGVIDLKAEIEVRDQNNEGKRLKTSVGRIIFNDAFPKEIGFRNFTFDKSNIKQIIADCANILSDEDLAEVLDRIKEMGFKFATKSGTTIAMSDIKVPKSKPKLIAEAEGKTILIESQYENGLITEDERYDEVVKVWVETTDKVTEATQKSLDPFSDIYMMMTSGAKGNITQIRQMAGMRGLMTNPMGKIIEFPIKSSFREGLTVPEYLISMHGALKGVADTALKTSKSGYLTRRLVDVAQDAIIRIIDCGTIHGIWVSETEEKQLLPSLTERVIGRLAAVNIVEPNTGKIIVARDEEIDAEKAAQFIAMDVKRVCVRSPLTCQATQGICQKCYGRDLARGKLVGMNTAVGIIAAQSIGEPGTQLTLRTFHTGGVFGPNDITTGLPRIEELFEARSPKNQIEGRLNPHDVLNISGKEAVRKYMVNEVQKVYRSQGVTINDKHIEIIVRQMLNKVVIDSSGETDLVHGELSNQFQFEQANAKVRAEGRQPATAHPVLLGITRAALSSDSWLAAASFQETTKVLTDRAIEGATDHLVGLNEKVITGQLIPEVEHI